MSGRTVSQHVLSCILPTAYILCNKSVLTLHGFKFPSVFLSWQILVAITAIILVSRPVLTFHDITSSLPESLLYVIVIYTGSRSLGVLSLPLFIGAEFLSLHCIETYILYQKTKLRSSLHVVTGVLCFLLLCILGQDIPRLQLGFLIAHSAAYGTQWHISRTKTITLSRTVSCLVCGTVFLILYGTVSGEITRAAIFDYSHTHFKLSLLLSGILSAGVTLTDDKEKKEHVSRCVAARAALTLMMGCMFGFSGDAIQVLIGSFFVFILLLDCYFSRAVSDPATTTAGGEEVV